jgi:hypothetical protein
MQRIPGFRMQADASLLHKALSQKAFEQSGFSCCQVGCVLKARATRLAVRDADQPPEHESASDPEHRLERPEHLIHPCLGAPPQSSQDRRIPVGLVASR